MGIIRGTAPGALRLAGRGQELLGEARRRLDWMHYCESHGHNARLTRLSRPSQKFQQQDVT